MAGLFPAHSTHAHAHMHIRSDQSCSFLATAPLACQTIKGVKGIPSNLAKEVNVKYRFFMDESYSVTPKSKVGDVT